MIKLSVIIPGYNTPQLWWVRAVESVLTALARCGGKDEAEVICVDDGSDTKPDFLAAYPVRVIYRPTNGGLSCARNSALAVARGTFVAFIDSDDEVRPDVYMRCLKRLQETGADIALYGVMSVWPDDGLAKTDIPCCDQGTLSEGALTPLAVKWLSDHCLLNYAWNKVYRLDFLRQNELVFTPEGMPFEDIEFNLRCMQRSARFCFVDYVGYIYYRTRGTLLSKYKKTLVQGACIVSEAWRKYKEGVSGSRRVLQDMGEIDKVGLANLAWCNSWMPGSPYSLGDRWCLRPGLPFVKMCAYVVLKKFFYFRVVRRMNTRRTYPHVVDWRG